jgi:hypothetical protein
MQGRNQEEKTMYFKVTCATLSILIISALGFYVGRNTVDAPAVAHVIKVDPEGNLQEQLAYHELQMKKYQEALIKEEANANLYLRRGQMNEVRQATSRKFQYEKKLEEHAQAIEELQKQT